MREEENMVTNNWLAWHCPLHQIPLNDQGEALICPNGDSFRRIDEIPRFVAPTSYADAFGAQWKRYRLTQLDSYTGLSITRDRARRCLGEVLWNDLSDKHVLEVGCGAGRFTEILLERGAFVTSIDLSAAVEANQENFQQNEKHRIGQADAAKLPFAPGQYDVVFCLGVIQHTPSPEDTIRCLYRQLKPGGVLVFDHYTFTLSNCTKIIEPLLRRFLMRLEPENGIRWTEKLVKIFLPLHRLVRGFLPAQYLVSRISPVRVYYHHYPGLTEELQREWAKLDTHDALTSWYRHWRTRGQLHRLLTSLGTQDIHCSRGGNGIEVRARRPS